jgi:hypothetical protein
MAIENRDLPVGTKLHANYKKTRYVCTVEAGEEDGSLLFVLEDGSKHKSPSAAGSKVMGGKAVNGCPCGIRLHTGTCTQSLSLPSCSGCLSPSSPL